MNTVTREWVKECWDEILDHIDRGFTGENLFIQRLEEIGVEVVEPETIN